MDTHIRELERLSLYGGTAAGGVVGGISNQIERIFGERSERQRWYIEHSTSLPWRLVANGKLTGDRWCSFPRGAEFRFVEKKKVVEAGLELADLVAFIWSQYMRARMGGPAFRYQVLLDDGLTTRPEILFG